MDIIRKSNAKQAQQSFQRKKTGAITFSAIVLTKPEKRVVKFMKEGAQKEMTSWNLKVSPLDVSKVELPKQESDAKPDDLIFERSDDGRAIVVKTASRLVTRVTKDGGMWLSVHSLDPSVTLLPGSVVDVVNVTWRQGKKISDKTGLKPFFCNGQALAVKTDKKYHWTNMVLKLKRDALDASSRPTRYPFDPASKDAPRLGYALYLKSDGADALERETGSNMKISGLDDEKSYYYEKGSEKERKQCLKAALTLRIWESLKWKAHDPETLKENYEALATCNIELMNWPSSVAWAGITDLDTWASVMPQQEGLAFITYAQVDERRTKELVGNFADKRSFKLNMNGVWVFADWIPYLQKHALHVTADYAKQFVRDDPKSGERYPDNPYNAPGDLEFVNMSEYRGNTDAIFSQQADAYRFFVIGDWDAFETADLDYLGVCSDADCDAILKGDGDKMKISRVDKKIKVLFAVKRSLIKRWNAETVDVVPIVGTKRPREDK